MESQSEALHLSKGLSVEIVNSGERSKLMFFNRHVRGVELTPDQCDRLSAMLTSKQNGPKPTSLLKKLVKEGYLDSPKDLKSIRKRLEAEHVWLKSSVLSVLLKEMAIRGDIVRAGDRRAYTFSSLSKVSSPPTD